jgi:hypothetical protein
MKRITLFDSPDSLVRMATCTVTFDEWCRLEVNRLKAGGRQARVVNRGSQIAVEASIRRRS